MCVLRLTCAEILQLGRQPPKKLLSFTSIFRKEIAASPHR
jgi:hypothetical protein